MAGVLVKETKGGLRHGRRCREGEGHTEPVAGMLPRGKELAGSRQEQEEPGRVLRESLRRDHGPADTPLLDS